MRGEFLDRYKALVKIPQNVLRNMYRTLAGDSSAAETASQKEVDERLLEALPLDDSDILLDLHKLNGNVKSSNLMHFGMSLMLLLRNLHLQLMTVSIQMFYICQLLFHFAT